MGHLLTWGGEGVHLAVSYLFAFSYSFWGSQGKNADMVCVPFSSGSCFVRTLYYPSWVALHDMAHSFIELHKVVIHVIILVSFL